MIRSGLGVYTSTNSGSDTGLGSGSSDIVAKKV